MSQSTSLKSFKVSSPEIFELQSNIFPITFKRREKSPKLSDIEKIEYLIDSCEDDLDKLQESISRSSPKNRVFLNLKLDSFRDDLADLEEHYFQITWRESNTLRREMKKLLKKIINYNKSIASFHKHITFN